ncbi:DNA cytosine methyltransferase [Leifsonia poae]|uniref:DNA cytosine methyltransferase n=1 Tax=Leifsonia poae TaxID=110933 RepID=UPI001CC18747|nr:DNA cytosine methyltransferase [Leifsonia poae]
MNALLTKSVGYKHPDIAWNGLTVTDLFCGAGGSSSGLVAAGYRVVIAANHWARAIESHQLNHPETDHSSADISQVNPAYFPRTDVLWASPECTNHSVAKGVKRQRAENAALFDLDGTRPLSDDAANRSRATMWDVPRFAEHHQYRAIIIENVVDAYRWVQFPAWLLAMELLGYKHEIVWLNSMHAQGGGLPAPQSRDRMYIVFWRKDLATAKNPRPRLERWTRPHAVCAEHGEIRAVQAFKKAEPWGRYRAQYVYRCPKCALVVEPAWLPAASAIDWSIRGERIGDRKKPLAEKTRLRIEKGIERYWKPLVVAAAGNTYDSASGKGGSYIRAYPADETMPTQSTTVQHGVAVPPLVVNNVSGADNSRSTTVGEVLPALVAGGTHASLLIPVEGREGKAAASVMDPMRTQSTRAETALMVPAGGTWRTDATPVSAVMATRTTTETDALVIPLRNHGVAKSAAHPIDTVAANGNHHALVMRNNQGGAEMSTPVAEPLRTLTTGGHQSLLVPYYGTGTASTTSEPVGTLTTTDRFGFAEGISLDVDDVEFRMLEPDEIKRGMAFPDDYVLLGTKREQVKQSGNAVTPPAARDLGRAVAEYLLEVAA